MSQEKRTNSERIFGFAGKTENEVLWNAVHGESIYPLILGFARGLRR
jgi:hypothetical protein